MSTPPTGEGSRCPVCGEPLPGPGMACLECMETEAGVQAQEFTGPRRIAGYRILRELGAGGMGTVFEAHEENMNRSVALKVLSRALPTKSARRFEQEAWIAGRLSHPNLVKVFDRGDWEDLHYYSMEMMDGGSLQDVLGNLRRWRRDDRWGLEFDSREYPEWAIRQIIEAARGLDYAHRQGVVHRDVKPMNLLLSQETGSVKVADFGLAIEAGATRLTTAGAVLGTFAYMAPEQILGKQDAISPHCDIFALGVTLFELLTLELPYAGPTQQLYLNAVLTSEARRARSLNSRISHDLETVLRKTLEKDPRDRYATAAALADDLENILRFRPIQASPPGPGTRAWKWARRKPLQAALVGILLVGTPGVVWLGRRAIEGERIERAAQVAELWDEVRETARASRYRETVERATALLDLDPGHALARRSRAISNMYLALQASGAERQERADRSLADLADLVARHPDRAWPLQLQALVERRLGMEERAAASEARAAAFPPGEQDTYFVGLNALLAGDFATAVEQFSAVHAAQADRPDALEYRAQAYEGLGKIDKAHDDLRFAAALAPNDARIQLELGALLLRSGDPEEGEPHLRQAVRLAPRDPQGWWTLTDDLLEQGRQATAEEDVDRARNRFQEAEAAAREALQIAPDRPWSHVNLGAALLEQHRLAREPDDERLREGIDSYERALALWTPSGSENDATALAGARINLCDALIQSGDLQHALTSCRETAELLADSMVAAYNLAAVYSLLDRRDEAFAALQRDVALGDDDADYLASDPWFASLRGDPRFGDLLARMRGLPH